MRCFGEWRRAAIALGLAVALGTGLAESTRAGIFFHTIPREAPAYDYATGGEFFAPPVPYGHYAKDPVGHVAEKAALASGAAHGLMNGLGSHLHGLGHGHGLGCGAGGCGHGLGHGLGGAGRGLGSGGLGHGPGGHGLGCGLGGCGLGGDLGAGGCGVAGHVHAAGANCGDPRGTTVVATRRVKNFGPIHPTTVVATAQTAPSAQAVVLPTTQVGHVVDPCSACHGRGCGLCGGGLLGKLKCNLCGGRGCGGCGGLGVGDPCSSCGGNGCGLCNGCGLLNKLKQCLFCHGAGCKFCSPNLKGKLHGLLGGLMGPKFDYFVGAGGPVPLTPGYVPYIVTTRSPRDFFAFPPRTPDGF